MQADDCKNKKPDSGYLDQLSRIRELTEERLADDRLVELSEMAALCEDIGNLYLNIADEIRAGRVNGRN